MRRINITDGRVKAVKDLKNHTIHIRLTAAEKLELREVAKLRGETISSLVMNTFVRNKDKDE